MNLDEKQNDTSTIHRGDSPPPFTINKLSAPPPQFFLDQERWHNSPSLENQQYSVKENHRFLSLSPFLGPNPSPSPVSTAHYSVQTRTPSPGFTRWSVWKRTPDRFT
ncbi:hypothetical protein BC941DRAFT_469281 [Chlamydoabsidia padenii]|nr:hypothetical protein BC941DRAFT_469281 [Chlamydoabsidia padenii]